MYIEKPIAKMAVCCTLRFCSKEARLVYLNFAQQKSEIHYVYTCF